jgi:hypothetical protein
LFNYAILTIRHAAIGGLENMGKLTKDQLPKVQSELPPQAETFRHQDLPFGVGSWVLPQSVGVFIVSLAASLLFLLLGPYSNFSSPGYIDPWLYTGYFTHFPYLLHHFGVTYYVSRLPWIIPGLIVFKVATPASASVLLNALIVAASIASLYLIIFWHYGNLPAALACIALMTNPYFISAVSWDYPDGPAIAYAFLGMACLLRPSRGRVSTTILGGAFLALSGYTNLAVLPVLLGMLAIPLWRDKTSPRELVRQGLLIILGIAAMTLILAIVGKLLINTYLFFMPQIDMIRYTRAHPDYLKNMWGTGYGWLPEAYRLFPPVFIVFLGGGLLMRRRKVQPGYIESYLCLVVTCALFCFFEFGLHNVGLRVAYCSTYIMAPLLAFAGMLIGECISGQRESRFHKLTVGVGEMTLKPAFTATTVLWVVVALFGLSLPFYFAVARPISFSRSDIWIGLFIVGLLAAISVFSLRPGMIPEALISCLIFTGLFVGPAFDPSLAYVWSADNASVFQTLMQIESLVDSGVPPDRTVRFWYDIDEPARPVPKIPQAKLAYLFDSAYSLYLWGYFDFTKQLPSGPTADLKRLVDAKTTFVHLSLMSDNLAERTHLLSARGIVVGNERRWIIPSNYGDLCVVLQDVQDDSGMH